MMYYLHKKAAFCIYFGCLCDKPLEIFILLIQDNKRSLVLNYRIIFACQRRSVFLEIRTKKKD